MNDAKWDLSRLSTGERCALRRSAGSLEFNVAAWRAFLVAGGGAEKGENYRYAAMCMECIWRPEDVVRVYPMETCLKLYLREREGVSESMKKRVDALLETPWSEDGFLLGKLYALVRILKTQTDFRPDFEALADDLRNWNRDGRGVQRKWLRAIHYGYEPSDKADGEGGNQP